MTPGVLAFAHCIDVLGAMSPGCGLGRLGEEFGGEHPDSDSGADQHHHRRQRSEQGFDAALGWSSGGCRGFFVVLLVSVVVLLVRHGIHPGKKRAN